MEVDVNDENEIGYSIKEENLDNVKITWVNIINDLGVKNLSRPVGNYITLECPKSCFKDTDDNSLVSYTLYKKLKELKPLSTNSLVFVVGVGSSAVLSDSLGPLVCSKIEKTEINLRKSARNRRQVCSFVPGVKGQNGLDTSRIIKSITRDIKPDVVILIDSLATSKVSRLGKNIQVSDTGMKLGAGLGNAAKSVVIDTALLKTAVISIGIPTVLDFDSYMLEAADDLLEKIASHISKDLQFGK